MRHLVFVSSFAGVDVLLLVLLLLLCVFYLRFFFPASGVSLPTQNPSPNVT